MRWAASKKRLLWRVLAIVAALFFVHYCFPSLGTRLRRPDAVTPDNASSTSFKVGRKALIVASLHGDDTGWLSEHFFDWERYVYTVNSQRAEFTVPKNKGRESNVYLTYIIENYHKLPDYMVFMHSLRYQWHNEDPMYDGVPMLKNLQLSHVETAGYANLRCTWTIGCPNEVKPRLDAKPAKDDEYSRDRVEAAYAEMFQKFFPGEPVPPEIGVHCGAQFAVSRDKVLERPLSDYQMYRQWLWDSTLDDSISGRILEYTWHMIMGKPPVHCPDAGECFCQKYGLCNLTCSESSCEKRYKLPQFATIPDGWPEVGPGKEGFPEKDWWL